MSSKYSILCLSHDPATIAFDGDFNQPEMAEEKIREGVEGHAGCDLAIGRYSYPLIELGCPASQDQPANLRCHHSSTQWTDSEWLRLLAVAYQSTDSSLPAVVQAGRYSCLPWERLRRLRDELNFPIAPDRAADNSRPGEHGVAAVWRQDPDADSAWCLTTARGLVTVPASTTREELQRFTDFFLGPAAESGT